MSLPVDDHDSVPDPDSEPEVPIDAADEVDSALGDEDDLLSTSSLTSSVFDYIQEHGRTYNAYGERTYVLPNDEIELDRLDLQHHLLKMTFNNQLSTCGVEKKRDLHRVLDIGTGTGIWSVEFGDLHPEAIVLGVDVSPVQPTYSVPPNVRFEVMDVGQPWVFSYQFDFIFSRFMTGAVADWRGFIRQCYENLAPGAMLEVQDISFHLACEDGTLPADSALAKWAAYMLEASKQLGCPLDSVESVRRIMIETGFVDVEETPYIWPMSPWKKDPTLKKIGVWTYHNFTTSLSGISLALFTRGLAWTADELEAFLIDVRKDMRNTRYHAFWPIYCISGTKPE
ncbi:uncharacterized protein PV07_05837 [Cladophialophora immunda]|uniref:Methyltransferase domain-containing protein n=1 Tax=Cladophialophora immunda TaxID=569365 RepID=A0A0D2CIZ4_9EURO|nr:uncharacterized protein PV07_05837 [Cladophialophora immunda]KIW30060.1 hypothetical protein PV07_05837 [Cladophialophora immunda]